MNRIQKQELVVELAKQYTNGDTATAHATIAGMAFGLCTDSQIDTMIRYLQEWNPKN